ncbi:MAG: SPOR domain-containing protein [Bacteroidales bacterium]|nr:SPOR domain-containing protein [Bacteroidales bacterium]
MKKIIISAIISFFGLTCLAQNINPSEEIKKNLDEDQLASIEIAETQKAKGDVTMESLKTKQDQVDKLKAQASKQKKSKAKKTQKEIDVLENSITTQKNSAYSNYEKANKTFYSVYYDNLQQLLTSVTDNSKKTAAEAHIDDAERFYNNSIDKLKTTPTGKKVTQLQILRVKEAANSLQNDAIANQIEAYATILGWYDKKEETSKSVEAKPIEQKPVSNDKIVFKVQIAADNNPLSIETLRKIYPSTENLNNELENGVYKYSVGFFKTYEEALAAKQKIDATVKENGIDTGVFIVGYKNGKRVDDIHEVYNPDEK